MSRVLYLTSLRIISSLCILIVIIFNKINLGRSELFIWNHPFSTFFIIKFNYFNALLVASDGSISRTSKKLFCSEKWPKVYGDHTHCV